MWEPPYSELMLLYNNSVPSVLEKISKNFSIDIITATEGNQKIIKKWLSDHEIKYDNIIFVKSAKEDLKNSDEFMIDVDKIKRDFPILSIKINGKPFVYLDNAATSQKPTQVIGSIVEYYSKYNANVHRGIYRISEKATEEYIKSKQKIRNLFF